MPGIETTEISASEVKAYKPGEIVAAEGEKNEFFFVILKGEVEIFQNNKSIRVLKEGDVFGLESFYLRRPCTTTSKTITFSRIASYRADLINEIVYTKPQLTEKILNSIMAQLEQTTQVAEENIPLAKLVDFNEQVYQNGEVIIEEGTVGKDIYMLVESEKGLLVSREGKEVGRITQPGEYFGEMSSLLNLKRTATVSSMGKSVVQIFPGDNLEATLAAYPSLAKKIIDTLASRLIDANRRITELSNGKESDFLSS
jgi:CRP-like cAMP-binding protein